MGGGGGGSGGGIDGGGGGALVGGGGMEGRGGVCGVVCFVFITSSCSSRNCSKTALSSSGINERISVMRVHNFT